jgi:hypothetical protein
MIPQKYSQLLFALILSCLMSLLVSGISTLRTIGLASQFAEIWMTAWLTAWLFAFPVVLLVGPLTQRMVRFLVAR